MEGLKQKVYYRLRGIGKHGNLQANWPSLNIWYPVPIYSVLCPEKKEEYSLKLFSGRKTKSLKQTISTSLNEF